MRKFGKVTHYKNTKTGTIHETDWGRFKKKRIEGGKKDEKARLLRLEKRNRDIKESDDTRRDCLPD
tara:strand:+ start:88 stop:285 length:198 start_codon:yes stop_codon:yes gene_type:complete